jgi:hypothetical protein
VTEYKDPLVSPEAREAVMLFYGRRNVDASRYAPLCCEFQTQEDYDEETKKGTVLLAPHSRYDDALRRSPRVAVFVFVHRPRPALQPFCVAGDEAALRKFVQPTKQIVARSSLDIQPLTTTLLNIDAAWTNKGEGAAHALQLMDTLFSYADTYSAGHSGVSRAVRFVRDTGVSFRDD